VTGIRWTASQAARRVGDEIGVDWGRFDLDVAGNVARGPANVAGYITSLVRGVALIRTLVLLGRDGALQTVGALEGAREFDA
jgi:hypothetical protein